MLLTPPIQRRSLLPTLLAGLMLTMCLAAMGALWAPSAQAHSELVSITPPDGATLEAAPTEIVLTFSANVIGDFTQIEVHDTAGAVTVPAAVSTDNTVTQPLPAALVNGTYTVVYKIVSADSHPISGQSTFTINAPAPVTSSPTASTEAVPSSPAPSEAGPDPTMSALITTASPGTDTTAGKGSPWRWIALFAVAGLALTALLVRRSRGRKFPSEH